MPALVAILLASVRLSGYVTDNAQVLRESDRVAIERTARDLEQKDGTQVALLTVASTQPQSVEEFALTVARENAVGEKGRNNGVLVVIAVDDRRARIEVGYGLEGKLTDALSSSIIRNEMVPKFRNQDYSGGARAGVEAVAGAIRGEYTARTHRSGNPHQGLLAGIAIFAILVTLLLRSRGRYLLAFFMVPVWTLGFWLLAGFGIVTALSIAFLIVVMTLSFLSSRSSMWGGHRGGSSWNSGARGSGSSWSGGGGSFGGGGSSGSW